MPVAFLLLKTEIGKIDEILSKVLEIDEVVEAYSVAGPYEIAAKIEAERFEKLAEIIPAKVHKIGGIVSTLTLPAFGVSKEFRIEVCERAEGLARAGRLSELYELCRECKQLKFCGYGARTINYGF